MNAFRIIACLLASLMLLQEAYTCNNADGSHFSMKIIRDIAERGRNWNAEGKSFRERSCDEGDIAESRESSSTEDSKECKCQERGESGGNDIDECTEKLLEDKWNLTFKYFDLNKDKILDTKDMAIQANVFANVYNLKGREKKTAKRCLHQFWSCLTLGGIDEGLSKDKLTTQILQSYRKDKAQTIQKIHTCIEILVNVLDHNDSGFLSVRELSVFFKSFHMGNKKLIKERYELMCPDTEQCCPIKNPIDYWTEHFIGHKWEVFDTLKSVYDSVGMPLAELVD